MDSFESLSDDDKLVYAHALERKGRDLVELLLRKRRMTSEIGAFLAPGDQAAVLEKIEQGIDGKVREAHAAVVAAEAQSTTDPDAATPVDVPQ